MQNVAKELGIDWFPCFCHVANLILGDFVSSINQQFSAIQNLQNHIGRSSVFKRFCIQENSKITSIPSFSRTRWYSAFSMLDAVFKLKSIIIKYIETEDQSISLDDNFWSIIQILHAIFKSFKEITNKLEKDCYVHYPWFCQVFDIYI